MTVRVSWNPQAVMFKTEHPPLLILRGNRSSPQRAPQLLLSRGVLGAIVDSKTQPTDGTLRPRHW